MKKPLLLMTALAVFTALLTACASSPTVESNLYIKGAPDWVNEGSQAISDGGGRFIHGVGMSAPVGDESLQKSVADNRARAAVARILSTSIDDQQGDYTAASGGVSNAAVDRDIKSTTQLALKGVKIIGRWRNRETGDIYAAAQLDLKHLDEAIQQAKSLSEETKQQFIKNSNMNFDRFVQENKP